MVSDLPEETFEPPSTPKGKLRAQINRLTVDFQYAIKHKLINRLRNLLKKAYDIAPSETEHLICHAEMIIRQHDEKEEQEDQPLSEETKEDDIFKHKKEDKAA